MIIKSLMAGGSRRLEELSGNLVLRAEGDHVIGTVDIVLHDLASVSGAHVVIGVGVGGGASALEPEKSFLDAVIPNWVLVLAVLSVWEGWHIDALFIPVGAATAA
jgi:hypothetical protein